MMANEEHVAIVKQGADAIQAWQRSFPGFRLDLIGADLSRLDLDHANLHRAKLTRARLHLASLKNANLWRAEAQYADFQGSDLGGANLIEAQLTNAVLLGVGLSGANLSRANMNNADLTNANLADASLIGSNLCRARFSGTRLQNADFDGAVVNLTDFGDVDLSTCVGLLDCEHYGPSTLGVDTLIRSQGNIPSDFLRQCGLPPWVIESARLYDPNLTANEISEILSTRVFDKRAHGPIFIGGIFISYSHADSKFVDKIEKGLKKAGAPVWRDVHHAVAGGLQKQIGQAIRLQDVVLLVLSKHSVESDWVENELEMARQKEKEEKRDVLCPVALDDSWNTKTTGDDRNRALWRKVRDMIILDFSKWKTKAFDGQFERLLRGLKLNYP